MRKYDFFKVVANNSDHGFNIGDIVCYRYTVGESHFFEWDGHASFMKDGDFEFHMTRQEMFRYKFPELAALHYDLNHAC